MDIDTLQLELEKYLNKKDLIIIREAYNFAEEKHRNTLRESGEPYIIHPLTVAGILASHRLDATTIAAGLLHDTVEDTKCSIKDLEKKFGKEIAMLVEGVTKITGLTYRSDDEASAEAIRRLMIATAKDLRVILIKLADRLHNMRTLSFLSEDRRLKMAKETINIYAPLAYRLGIASLKWELEDLSFKYTEPAIYQKFKLRFGKKREDRENDINKLIMTLEKELSKRKIQPVIIGRPKHFYSIYKKMISKGRAFEEVNDLIGLRVIVKEPGDCYETLGVIHSLWPPIHGKFKDYIAMPKKNLYQSLHTAVVALKQPVEFQIRTKEMDATAEEGIAAHWRYKQVAGDKNFDKKLSWLREVLEWQKGSENTKEFMEFLKIDLFYDEIYVMTPKGDVVSLPAGSCAIDFAYAIHTSIGDRCNGAVVNGRIVPLRYILKTGDIVNILTSKTPSPKRDWLKIVKTTTAKSKIRRYIRVSGGIPIHVSSSVSTADKLAKSIVLIGGVSNNMVKLSRCCHPIPNDKIIAYPSSKLRYSVHKFDCPHFMQKDLKKDMVKVSWNEDCKFQIMLKIIADDRVGLFADILNTIAAANVNVDPAKAQANANGVVECDIGFIPEDLDHISHVINRIKKIRGVKIVFLNHQI